MRTFFSVGPTSSTQLVVEDVPSGEYEVGVLAQYAFGTASITESFIHTIVPASATVLLAEFRQAVLYASPATIKNKVWSILGGNGFTGTSEDSVALYVGLLDAIPDLYPKLQEKSTMEVLQAVADHSGQFLSTFMSLCAASRVKPCHCPGVDMTYQQRCPAGATPVPDTRSLRSSLYSAVESYFSQSLADQTVDVNANFVTAASNLIHSLRLAFVMTPETLYSAAGTNSTIAANSLDSLVFIFDAMETFLRAKNGPLLPNVQPLVSDGNGSLTPYNAMFVFNVSYDDSTNFGM